MEKITLGQALKASSPHPFGLVVSTDENNTVNAMGVSWWTHVSSSPPLLLVCLSKKSYSNTNLKKSNEFVLCLPDPCIAEESWKCSTTSGRNIDKIKEFGLKLLESNHIKPPILKDSHVAYECKVSKIVEAGDHDIFVSEILAAYCNPEKQHLYTTEGYKKLIEL